MDFYKIKSKAEYIADIALDAALKNEKHGIVETAELQAIYNQLCEIADKLDECHNWEAGEDD